MTQTNSEIVNANSDEISVKDLILAFRKWRQYLLGRWKIILIVTIFGAALGLAYAAFNKPVYSAELSFALDDDKASGGGLGGVLGLASQFGLDMGNGGGGAFSGDNLLALMQSRSMVEKTLLTPIAVQGKEQTLAELYVNFNKLRAGWEDNKDLKNIQFFNTDRFKYTLQQDSILGIIYKSILKGNLTVDKVDKKLSIITVKVDSRDELFSKYFAEILVKTVSDFYIATKTKKSVQNIEILQRQTDSIRRELNAALTGVASSADVNPNANPALQILRVPSQRRQVDVQADQAILTQLVTNLEISKVTLRKETPLVQIIDRPILPLDKKKFGKLKGLVVGGFIGVLLIIVALSINRFYKKMIM